MVNRRRIMCFLRSTYTRSNFRRRRATRKSPERWLRNVVRLFGRRAVLAASAFLKSNLVGREAKRRFPKAPKGCAYPLGSTAVAAGAVKLIPGS